MNDATDTKVDLPQAQDRTVSPRPRILYCHCAKAQVVPPEVKTAVLRHLCDSGEPFEAVADLCELAARQDPALKAFADGAPLLVAACHPRAVKWLFAAAGAPLPADPEVANLRKESAETVCAKLPNPEKMEALPGRFERVCAQLESQSPATEGWMPWFPVIDYNRCNNCMQCLGFCLFGVYGVDGASRVQARSPRQCKTSCPACARVCPEAAILFPKHPSDSISGGQVEAADREKMKVDISALLGGDIYSQLRQRGERTQPRFSKDRDPQTALKERRRHLAAMVQSGEIPPEVLAGLLSPEELAKVIPHL